MAKSIKTPLAALGAAFLATSIAPAVSADVNPFAATQLHAGYDLANYDQHEGNCGGKMKTDKEGNCGGAKAKKEGSCGEAKTKEGKCGEAKAAAMKASKEGKCGEAKCGANKK